MGRNDVSVTFTSFNIEVNQEGCPRDWALSRAVVPV